MVVQKKIAESIVKDCLRISGKDVVVVSTFPHTIDLANAIAMECYKTGADVLMTLDTDEVHYGHLKVLPIENLKTTSKHCLGLAEYSTVEIWLGGPENPLPMRKIPREKYSALFEGEKAHFDKNLAKAVKTAFVATGLVTAQRAKTYGFSYQAWKKMMNAAIAVKYTDISKLGRKLATELEKTATVHITSKEGTDLSFQLDGRPSHMCDGIIDDEDFRKGTYHTNLPAGAIFVLPVETSAEGRVVFDAPIPQLGKKIEGLEWAFSGGRVTDFKARKNVELARDFWDRAHGDKDIIGSLSLGLNPRAKIGFLVNYIVLGAVSVGIGDNRDIGGKNNSDYGFSGTMTKATVVVDGKTIVKDGKYQV